MALDQIPPWLDVHPRDFVSAMESGARAGEAAASLDQRAQESAAETALKRQQLAQQSALRQDDSGFQQQKFTAELSESAADRAMKERLAGQQQRFNADKFNVGVGLDTANLGIRQQNEARADRALKDRERDALNKLKLTADNAVRASSFGQDLSETKTKEDYYKLLKKYPEIITNAGYQKAYNSKYQSDFPKASSGNTSKMTRRTEIDPTTGAEVSRVETVTGPLGARDETDHVAKPTNGPVKVSSAEDYDKLAPGASYIDPKGNVRTKKAAAADDAGTRAAFNE